MAVSLVHAQQSATPAAPAKGADTASAAPAGTATGVQVERSVRRRKRNATERAVLALLKRDWRDALTAANVGPCELAARFDVSHQYVARCLSDAHDDAPHPEWEYLAPEPVRAALGAIRSRRLNANRAPRDVRTGALAGVFAASDLLRGIEADLADGKIDPTEATNRLAAARELSEHAQGIVAALEALAKGGGRS